MTMKLLTLDIEILDDITSRLLVDGLFHVGVDKDIERKILSREYFKIKVLDQIYVLIQYGDNQHIKDKWLLHSAQSIIKDSGLPHISLDSFPEMFSSRNKAIGFLINKTLIKTHVIKPIHNIDAKLAIKPIKHELFQDTISGQYITLDKLNINHKPWTVYGLAKNEETNTYHYKVFYDSFQTRKIAIEYIKRLEVKI